jgi:hypothetical protein
MLNPDLALTSQPQPHTVTDSIRIHFQNRLSPRRDPHNASRKKEEDGALR